MTRQNRKNAREARIIAARDSFENTALDSHKTRLAGCSEKRQGTALYRLTTYIIPIIGKKHNARLEATEILALVRNIENKGNNETARRILQVINQIFRFAIAMEKNQA